MNDLRYKLLVTILVLMSASVFAVDVSPQIDAGNQAWADGNVEEAEAQFRQAIKLNPDVAKPYARLAALLLTQNNNIAAIETYKTAITKDPENADLFVGLALAYLHQQSYSLANAMVNQALQLNPELENAQKMQEYIQKKRALLQQAPMPADHPNTVPPATESK